MFMPWIIAACVSLSTCIGPPSRRPQGQPAIRFSGMCVREIRVARKVAKNIKPRPGLWPGARADNNNNNRPTRQQRQRLKSHQEIYGPKLCVGRGRGRGRVFKV